MVLAFLETGDIPVPKVADGLHWPGPLVLPVRSTSVVCRYVLTWDCIITSRLWV